jgi:hypothetical protein
VGANDLSLRKCLETKVDIFRKAIRPLQRLRLVFHDATLARDQSGLGGVALLTPAVRRFDARSNSVLTRQILKKL